MKKIVKSLLGLALVVPLLSGAGISAATADGSETCANGKVCLYPHANWDGGKTSNNYSVSYVGATGNDPSANIVGYTVNPAYKYVMFYEHLNWSGNSFYMREGQAVSNLQNIAYPGGGSWNDKISSHDEAY